MWLRHAIMPSMTLILWLAQARKFFIIIHHTSLPIYLVLGEGLSKQTISESKEPHTEEAKGLIAQFKIAHVHFIIVITFIFLFRQMFWLTHSFFLSCVAAAFMGWFTALTAMVNVHDAR